MKKAKSLSKQINMFWNHSVSTSDAIAAQINNYNRNVSGGSIVDMGLKYTVKGVSVLEDINDLENIVVGFKQAAAAQGATSGSTASARDSCLPARCCHNKICQ